MTTHLTPKEHEVLRELCSDGAPNHVIADRLGIARHTVRAHFSSISKKTDLHTRTAIALWYVRVVDPEEFGPLAMGMM